MVGTGDRNPRASVGDVRRRLALERSRLFDQEAERYDRCRPGYPHEVIDELFGPGRGGSVSSTLVAAPGSLQD